MKKVLHFSGKGKEAIEPFNNCNKDVVCGMPINITLDTLAHYTKPYYIFK